MKRRHEISEQEEIVLKQYHDTLDVELLKTICDEKVAHTIDVVLKEAIRTYKEDDLSGCTDKDDNSITTSFVTSYKLFDPNLVFFGEYRDNDDYWGFPITIYKSKEDGHTTNWKNHNYIYADRGYEYLDENGLLCNFYQDIDIFGTEKTWTWDLTKALFMVVYETHKYWLELKEIEEDDFDLDDLDKEFFDSISQDFEKSIFDKLSSLMTKSKDDSQDIPESKQ